jgi:hypothetical protein
MFLMNVPDIFVANTKITQIHYLHDYSSAKARFFKGSITAAGAEASPIGQEWSCASATPVNSAQSSRDLGTFP